jgi:hypothetical protein
MSLNYKSPINIKRKMKTTKSASKTNNFYLLLASFSILAVLALAAFYIKEYNLTNPQNVKEEILGASASISDEEKFWTDFLKKYPSYFPGWIELAIIELEQGNRSAFLKAINTAKEIDPNSKEVKSLESSN